MIVVIPCGAKKINKPAPACNLYIGPYFKACWSYSISLTNYSNIYILSAKHGLIKSTTILYPYNLQMGQPGSIGLKKIEEQASEYGIINKNIIGLGGIKYTSLMKQVFGKESKYPITGLQMGYAIKWLKENKGVIV